MAPAHTLLPAASQSFVAKKASILKSLAAPSYTDASPKGSVDTGIVDLIDKINALEGLVTTSSCAGRVSVFLEGGNEDKKQERSISPGGKGGGKWLFVSHDPVSLNGDPSHTFTSKFSLSQPTTPPTPPGSHGRFIRFQYEPMILHILCASLAHAQPVLAAAISSGFRESGVQSLKNLEDPDSLPMVAVRSHGLALESVIGVLEDGEKDPRSFVSEEYLIMLVGIANERFEACQVRKKRFEDALFGRQREAGDWEDADARKKRKREEGLKRQREKDTMKKNLGMLEITAEDYDNLDLQAINNYNANEDP